MIHATVLRDNRSITTMSAFTPVQTIGCTFPNLSFLSKNKLCLRFQSSEVSLKFGRCEYSSFTNRPHYGKWWHAQIRHMHWSRDTHSHFTGQPRRHYYRCVHVGPNHWTYLPNLSFLSKINLRLWFGNSGRKHLSSVACLKLFLSFEFESMK